MRIREERAVALVWSGLFCLFAGAFFTIGLIYNHPLIWGAALFGCLGGFLGIGLLFQAIYMFRRNKNGNEIH